MSTRCARANTPSGGEGAPRGRTPGTGWCRARGDGLLDRRPGLEPPPSDGPEASRRQRSDTERRQAARGAQIPLRQRQQSRGDQPVNATNGSSLTTMPKKSSASAMAMGAAAVSTPRTCPERQPRPTTDTRPAPSRLYGRRRQDHSHQCLVPTRPRPVNTMTWTDADGAQLTGEHSYTMSPPPPRRPTRPGRSRCRTCATPVSSPTQSIAIPSAIAPGTGEVCIVATGYPAAAAAPAG